MTPAEFIIALFSRIDNPMGDVPQPPKPPYILAKRWP